MVERFSYEVRKRDAHGKVRRIFFGTHGEATAFALNVAESMAIRGSQGSVRVIANGVEEIVYESVAPSAERL